MDMDDMSSNEDSQAPQEPEQDAPGSGTPRPQSPVPGKGLPWAPKVRNKDLDLFLENTRLKFIGFSLPGQFSKGLSLLIIKLSVLWGS